MKTRNISLSEAYETALFDLSLKLSGRLRKRVTVSELIRIGIDCLIEMDEDELLELVEQR